MEKELAWRNANSAVEKLRNFSNDSLFLYMKAQGNTIPFPEAVQLQQVEFVSRNRIETGYWDQPAMSKAILGK